MTCAWVMPLQRRFFLSKKLSRRYATASGSCCPARDSKAPPVRDSLSTRLRFEPLGLRRRRRCSRSRSRIWTDSLKWLWCDTQGNWWCSSCESVWLCPDELADALTLNLTPLIRPVLQVRGQISSAAGDIPIDLGRALCLLLIIK